MIQCAFRCLKARNEYYDLLGTGEAGNGADFKRVQSEERVPEFIQKVLASTWMLSKAMRWAFKKHCSRR